MQFAVRLDIMPVPGEFFTNVTCITVAYPEKHMHVVPHNLNTFANVILEVTVCKCSTKKVFLKIVQNLQEKTYAGVSFLKKCRPPAFNLRGFIPLIFSKKSFLAFSFLMFFGTLNYGESTMLFIFVGQNFLCFYFPLQIDSLEECSVATDIATSFTCFKSQFYTRKSSFYLFLWSRTP